MSFSLFDSVTKYEDIKDIVDSENDINYDGALKVNVTKLSQYIEPVMNFK